VLEKVQAQSATHRETEDGNPLGLKLIFFGAWAVPSCASLAQGRLKTKPALPKAYFRACAEV